MSLVMSPVHSPRHHLLRPSKPPAALPISIPIQKKGSSGTGNGGRTSSRARDPSPDMLFDMSPSEDAPIHYRPFLSTTTAADPPSPSPHIRQIAHSPSPSTTTASFNRRRSQNLLATPKSAFRTASSSSTQLARTAPISFSFYPATSTTAAARQNKYNDGYTDEEQREEEEEQKQNEPFLYTFPMLSPSAAKSAPHSLPSRASRLRVGSSGIGSGGGNVGVSTGGGGGGDSGGAASLRSGTHTPSPPFGSSSSSRATPPRQPQSYMQSQTSRSSAHPLTSAFRSPGTPSTRGSYTTTSSSLAHHSDRFSNEEDDDEDDDDLPPDAFFGSPASREHAISRARLSRSNHRSPTTTTSNNNNNTTLLLKSTVRPHIHPPQQLAQKTPVASVRPDVVSSSGGGGTGTSANASYYALERGRAREVKHIRRD